MYSLGIGEEYTTGDLYVNYITFGILFHTAPTKQTEINQLEGGTTNKFKKDSKHDYKLYEQLLPGSAMIKSSLVMTTYICCSVE